EGESLTYADLDARVDALAAELTTHGVTRNTVVAVALPRSTELVVALLAVQRAGGAYVPLDPDYPEERRAFMLADSGAHVILTPAEGGGGKVPPPPPPPSGWERGEDPRPDDAAYVIYTSGSTGQPKGVVITHRAIVNRLAWMQSEYGLTPDDRVLQKTPASFDV